MWGWTASDGLRAASVYVNAAAGGTGTRPSLVGFRQLGRIRREESTMSDQDADVRRQHQNIVDRDLQAAAEDVGQHRAGFRVARLGAYALRLEVFQRKQQREAGRLRKRRPKGIARRAAKLSGRS